MLDWKELPKEALLKEPEIQHPPTQGNPLHTAAKGTMHQDLSMILLPGQVDVPTQHTIQQEYTTEVFQMRRMTAGTVMAPQGVDCRVAFQRDTTWTVIWEVITQAISQLRVNRD